MMGAKIGTDTDKTPDQIADEIAMHFAAIS